MNLVSSYLPKESEIYQKLNNARITTLERLLTTSEEVLAQNTGIKRDDLVTIKQSIVESCASVSVDGLRLAQFEKENIFSLRTGCTALDDALDGGIVTGEITELIGHCASGKTQVCLSILGLLVCHYNVRSIYIDTTNAFRGDRFSQIVRANKSSDTDAFKLKSSMANMRCIKVFSALEVVEVLESLLKACQTGDQKDSPLRLIILDTITTIISPLLGGTKNGGRVMMATIGQLLKKLAISSGAAVIITNSTVTNGTGNDSKPALGVAWGHMATMRLMLRKIEQNISSATILKSNRSATGNVAHFCITKNGIEDET